MDKDYLYYRELYHYGIKGQKWGVRRFEDAVASWKANRQQKKDEKLEKKKEYLKNTDPKEIMGHAMATGAKWTAATLAMGVGTASFFKLAKFFDEYGDQGGYAEKVENIMNKHTGILDLPLMGATAGLMGAGLITSAAVGKNRLKAQKMLKSESNKKK